MLIKYLLGIAHFTKQCTALPRTQQFLNVFVGCKQIHLFPKTARFSCMNDTKTLVITQFSPQQDIRVCVCIYVHSLIQQIQIYLLLNS